MRFQEPDSGILAVPPQVADYCITLAGHAQAHRDPHAARHLANIGERYGAGMVCGRSIAGWRALADEIEPTTTGGPVSILDRTHTHHSGEFAVSGVSSVDPAERVRLTVEARIAALRSAAELAAAGRISPDTTSVTQRAARLEEWILRDGSPE